MARPLLRPIGRPRDARPRRAHSSRATATPCASATPRSPRAAPRSRRGWGAEYVERVHEKGKLTARERIARLDRSGHAASSRSAPSSTTASAFRRAALARRRRGHRVRARRGPLVHGHRQRQHGRVGRVVAAHAGEDRARAEDGAAPAPADRSTSSTARGLFLPEQSQRFPGRTGAGHIFKMNSLLSRRRRAADRRRVRRLHRGRRLHADHQRPRLHDRAGLHGHRRRGADQRREEPEAHLARHRRPRGARAPVRLRRRARARRRDRCSRCIRARGRAAARARRADFYRGGADALRRRAIPPRELAGLLPRRPPRGLRRRRGARAPRRPEPVLGGPAATRARR